MTHSLKNCNRRWTNVTMRRWRNMFWQIDDFDPDANGINFNTKVIRAKTRSDMVWGYSHEFHEIWVIWFQVQDLTEVDPGCFTFLVGKCLELPVVEDLQFLQCQLWVFLEIARPLVEHVPTLGLHQLDLIDLDWLHCCLCCLQDQHIELIVGKQEDSQQIEDWQRSLICVASK